VLLLQDHPAEGLEHLKEASRLNPNDIGICYNLGMAQRRQGQPTEAVQAFRRTLEINPHFLNARSELGYALWQLHRRSEAVQEWQAALKINPDDPGARNGLRLVEVEAWRLATTADPAKRDPATAYELARQVCQATRDPTVEALEALAAALAGVGRYEEAVRTARQARDLAASDWSRAREIEARIQLYEKGKAFVAPSDREQPEGLRKKPTPQSPPRSGEGQ
jgi:Flp pilus assembly protein TadD